MSKKDPFAEREAKRYEQPIPSREFILERAESYKTSFKRKQLIQDLHLETPQAVEALRRRLTAMVRDGQLVKMKGAYGLPTEQRHVEGVLKLERDGGGSIVALETHEASAQKIYITPRDMRGLCEGDTVELRVTHADARGQVQGIVVRVLTKATPRLVARYRKDGSVEPRHRFYRGAFSVTVPPTLSPQESDWVLVQVVRGETGREAWQGLVVEVLGAMLPFDLELNTILLNYHLSFEWPEKVLEEVANLPSEHDETLLKERLDLRSLPLVTIDGEDARDFDDAVFCEQKPRGAFALWVAIADVSSYVPPGTALDKEASLRGTSVYFPHTVIPMLPEELSNGVCSLNPKEDRLALVCQLHLSAKGVVTQASFHRAVMRSKERLTYTQVADMLSGDKSLQKTYAAVWPDLQVLHALFLVLQKRRQARGAIEFESVETRMLFNAQQGVENILPVVRNVAHRMIEECMLLANVAAANFLIEQKLPTLFRVHAGPTLDKLRDLRNYLGLFGLSLPGKDHPKPKDYAALLSQIAQRKDADILQTVLLRSLSQAVYTPKNTGHFGLAYPAYVHFTSPIRRYPDLLVHRVITAALCGEKVPAPKHLEALGELCSLSERRADEAAREMVLAMKCHYIQKYVGDVFDATVTAVTSFGLFAELKGLYVEGLIHISTLGNDYYQYDQSRYQLRGDNTGVTFNIGDSLTVRLARVDIEDRKVDLELLKKAKA